MILSRETDNSATATINTSNHCSKEADDFWIDRKACAVYANFYGFGNGSRRTSDFVVSTKWEDVQKLIEKFCEAGNAEAIALRDAAILAATIKELGWQPPGIHGRQRLENSN